MPNQFHSLLASHTQESLLNNLNLPPAEEADLVNAAKEIRSAIVTGFAALRDEVRRQRLDYEVPRPKFAIQGSYIYGTLNAPANPPKQQVDIDLGMYLPFSALGDGAQPKTATGYYFNAVTGILREHVRINGKDWNIPDDCDQKDTCVRVILNDKTHIDIPLYAVPEGELGRVTEAQIAINKQEQHFVAMDRDDEFLMEAYAVEAVTPDVIHMANRKEGWLPSDALVIRDWVRSQFRVFGSMIRPVNRFLKAWRDHVWPEGGGPSSIFLLAHSLRSFPEDKDGLTHCEALEAVINELPAVFSRPLLVSCPTSQDKNAKEDLRDRIDGEKQALYQHHFETLRAQYSHAKCSEPQDANATLIEIFGKRMPRDPSRIVVTNNTAAKVAAITATEPDVLPLYTTDRSNSG